MGTDEDADGIRLVLEAARSIRHYLPDLVGDDAVLLDEELAALLVGPAAGVDEAILDVLEPCDATRAWVSGFFRTGLPPEVVEAMAMGGDVGAMEVRVRAALAGDQGGSAPAGDPVIPVLPARYACPRDPDYIAYRLDGAEAIPVCTQHLVPLVPAPIRAPRPGLIDDGGTEC